LEAAEDRCWFAELEAAGCVLLARIELELVVVEAFTTLPRQEAKGKF